MAVKFSESEIASYTSTWTLSRGRSKFPLLTIQVGTVPPPRGAPDLLSTSRKHNVGWQTFQRSVTLINARVFFWNNDLTRPTLGLVLPSSPSLFHWAGCRKIKSFAGRCVCVCVFFKLQDGSVISPLLSLFWLSAACFVFELFPCAAINNCCCSFIGMPFVSVRADDFITLILLWRTQEPDCTAERPSVWFHMFRVLRLRRG